MTGVGVLVFALSMFSRLDPSLLAAVAATALVLAGVYLTLPGSLTARTRYRLQPKFQALAGVVAFAVAAGLDYAVFGALDWPIAIGVGIGVLIASGFFRSRTRP